MTAFDRHRCEPTKHLKLVRSLISGMLEIMIEKRKEEKKKTFSMAYIYMVINYITRVHSGTRVTFILFVFKVME